MRSPRSRPLVGLLASVLVLVLAACSGGDIGGGADDGANGQGGSASSGSGDDGELTRIKVGVLPVVHIAPVYLGIQEGFFAEEGLEVEPVPVQGGAALLPSVLQGEVQFGYSNVVSLMIAKAENAPVSIISNGELSVEPGVDPDEQPPGQALMVAGDSDIQDVTDLAGRTIAINTLGNINEVLTKHAIDRAGGDSSGIELIELGQAQMPAALAEGQVDVVAVNEPYTTIAADQGARVLLRPFTDLDDPASNIAAYFTTSSYIEQEPEVVQGFVAALARATELAQEDGDAVREILPSYTTLEPELAERVVLPHYTNVVNGGSVEELARISVDYGLLSEPVGLDEFIHEQAPAEVE